MKQFKFSLLIAALCFGSFVRADEGMWLPFLLKRNYQDMKEHGLRLSAEEIYSINNSSIKDAIISFNGYCTGEVISDKGLILTNHHCGYPSISKVSSPEKGKNYLHEGFWAKNHDSEIPIDGLFASFIVRIENVTETVLENLNDDMSEDERKAAIKVISKTLEADAVRNTHYSAFVEDFFEGNEFYLFVQEKYTDVRLVGTPPESAGKFGGDTDNWMWPRHTADFSMFRIYANKENMPAGYSTDNVPLKPKHSLPVSLKGVAKDDFAMILGFPGSTDRYLSSWGVTQLVSKEYPTRIDIRAKKLEVMKKHMDKDVGVQLNYSATYAQVANYWKNFIGMSLQVRKNHVVDKKQAIESQFREYLINKRINHDIFGSMENYYKLTDDIMQIKGYYIEFSRSVTVNRMASDFSYWVQAKETGNEDLLKRVEAYLFGGLDNHFEKANNEIEIEIIHDVLNMYIDEIPQEQMGEYTKSIAAKGHAGVDKFTKKLRKKSIFVDKERFEAFKANPNLKKLKKDPLYLLMKDMTDAYNKVANTEEIKKAKDALTKANRLFVAGLRDMNPDKEYYPNANSTLRLTYGNVLPYDPRDAVAYDYVTTLDGVMEKEDPSNHEFVVDSRIKELWQKKDYGQYADSTGNLVVNFLSNNDITGGNSGSPVINGDGQLIGTAFDGNWEAMSGDIYFEPNIQRTISVDIRYTLWLVDKCYGATNLIEEMNIIK